MLVPDVNKTPTKPHNVTTERRKDHACHTVKVKVRRTYHKHKHKHKQLPYTNTNTNSYSYLWQRRRMRRAPRSPVPATGTEPPKQTHVPPFPRPLRSVLRCRRLRESQQLLWLRSRQPLSPLAPFPVNRKKRNSHVRLVVG